MQQHIIRSAAFFNPLSTQNYYTMFYTSVKHLYGKLNSLGQFPEPFNFKKLLGFTSFSEGSGSVFLLGCFL